MESRNGRPLRPNRGQNPNARWLVDDTPKQAPPPKRRKTPVKPKTPKAEEITEGEVRCKCEGAVSDDKTMAECESCKNWQHIVCEAGVDDESALPEPYACWKCRETESDKEDADDTKVATEKSDIKEEEPEETGIAAIKDTVRRSVAEQWQKIVVEASSATGVKTDPEQLALDLEQALYDEYATEKDKDVGHVYRERFRMLSFNLKDAKNPGLQRSVLTRKTPPAKFVTMTSQELRSPELERLAAEVHEESIRDTVIAENEPPKERVSTGTAEVNVEPTFVALDEEEEQNSDDLDEAMKEPLGPPPPSVEEEGGDEKAMKFKSPAGLASAPPPLEKPVWKGRVKLDKIVLDAAGMHLTGDRNSWPKYIDSQATLSVTGTVRTDKGLAYLKETANEPDWHGVISFALVSEDRATLAEVWEYLKSRERIGSVATARDAVKDTYLIPWDGGDAPEYLSLDGKQTEFLEHLKTEHDDGKVLLAVFVLYK